MTQHGVQRCHGRDLQSVEELQYVLAVGATPDPVFMLDRHDVDPTVRERTGRAGIVSRFVAPNPVVDLRRVRRLVVRRAERHDLTPARDCGQIIREGGDPAAPRGIGRDEGGSDEGTPIVHGTDAAGEGNDAPTGSVAAEELERYGGPAQAHDPDRAETGEAGTGPIRRPA